VLELDARGRRLRDALAAVLVNANEPELRLAHQWLDTWAGVGLLVAGITWQGCTELIDVTAHDGAAKSTSGAKAASRSTRAGRRLPSAPRR